MGNCIKCNTNDDFCSKFDLISESLGTINVKSSKLFYDTIWNKYYWTFSKPKTQTIPDNYICLGFNETRTNIERVLIIPGDSNLVTKYGIIIINSKRGLSRASQYEVDATLYNKVYKNIDITTLPEFRTLNRCYIERCCQK